MRRCDLELARGWGIERRARSTSLSQPRRRQGAPPGALTRRKPLGVEGGGGCFHPPAGREEGSAIDGIYAELVRAQQAGG
jgi:hypothetical protein